MNEKAVMAGLCVGWLCLCTGAVPTPPVSPAVLSVTGGFDPRLQRPQWHLDTAAEGQDHQVRSQIPRKLILEEVNGNSNFFFPPCFLSGLQT